MIILIGWYWKMNMIMIMILQGLDNHIKNFIALSTQGKQESKDLSYNQNHFITLNLISQGREARALMPPPVTELIDSMI